MVKIEISSIEEGIKIATEAMEDKGLVVGMSVKRIPEDDDKKNW